MTKTPKAPSRAAAIVERLEGHYAFECEGGPLKNCIEWQELCRLLACESGACGNCQQCLTRELFDVGEALDGQYPGDRSCVAFAVQCQNEALERAEAELSALREKVVTLRSVVQADQSDAECVNAVENWLDADLQQAVTPETEDQ